jgi:hypothetical protein
MSYVLRTLYNSTALPPRKIRYPLYRRLGGPQGWSGRVRKISPLPGFDPQTVQSVASRYTVWAVPVQGMSKKVFNITPLILSHEGKTKSLATARLCLTLGTIEGE